MTSRSQKFSAIFFFVFLFSLPLLFAQVGANDLTFNPDDRGNGYGDGVNAFINAMDLQPDGKILIGGYFSSYDGVPASNLARLNPDGTIDESFTASTAIDNSVTDVKVLPDGKILVAGDFVVYTATLSSFRLVRLNADGTLDTSFAATIGTRSSFDESRVSGLAVQADGKIIVVGKFAINNRNGIVRLNPNGSFDESFQPGTGVGASEAIGKIKLHQDGYIISGGFTTYNGVPRLRLARINQNGSLDTGFDPGTSVNSSITDIYVHTNRILVVGNFTTYQGVAQGRIVALTGTGTVDPTFNAGTGSTEQAGTIQTVFVRSDGSIIITGGFTTFNGVAAKRIALLDLNGAVVPSFGGDGFGGVGQPAAVRELGNGKLLMAGINMRTYDSKGIENIIRINTDGSLDGTFHATGTGANGSISTLAVQPDQKILIGGQFTKYNGVGRSRIARLLSTGLLDTSFDPGKGADDEVKSLAFQANGKVVVGGTFSLFNGASKKALVRLNANGSIDDTFTPPVFGTTSSIYAIAIQADDKIVIGGFFTVFKNGSQWSNLVRLNADGTIDDQFATGGPNQFVTHVLVKGTEITIAGWFTQYGGVARNKIAVLNGQGQLTSANPGASFNALVTAMVHQSDGKLIVGGETSKLARFDLSGSRDNAFFSGTGMTNAFTGEPIYAYSLAVDANDKILMGGYFTSVHATDRNGLARLNADGSLDGAFESDEGMNSRSINALKVQGDGKILVGGAFTNYARVGRNRITRLLVACETPQLAAAPVVTENLELCPGVSGVVSVEEGTLPHGGEWRWYSGSCDGTQVGTGKDLTVLSETKTYYVRAAGSCVAPQAPCAQVEVVRMAIPVVTVTAGSRCDQGTVELKASTSVGEVNWYALQQQGEKLFTGLTFVTPSLTTTTTYYAEGQNGACLSAARVPVVATVTITPQVTSTLAAERCGSGTVALGAFSPTGALAWFTSETATTSVGTSAAFTTPALTATTVFFVEAATNECKSARTPVTATIKPIPQITTAYDGEKITATITNTVTEPAYSWINCGTQQVVGGNTASFAVPQTPTDESYAVVVTAQGCPATSACSKIVSITDELATVNLFPNPSNGRFFIDLAGPGVKHISVVDLTGKRVHHEVTSAEGLVEIKLATPGAYVVSVSHQSGSFRQKVFVE